jgi:hypothetical protein
MSDEISRLREELKLLKEKHEMLLEGVEHIKRDLASRDDSYSHDDYYAGTCSASRETSLRLGTLLVRVKTINPKTSE